MGRVRNAVLRPWVVMPLVALLALGAWYVTRPDDDGSTTSSATSNEQVLTVTSGTMATTVSAEGTIAAADTDDLSFTSAGTVTAVDVEAGDTVKTGQVLATIDSSELDAVVADAEASVADAEAKLADDQDASASDEQIEADESSLAAAQDQLDDAQEALDGARLVASFDGTVASVGIAVGEELGTGGTGGTSATGSGSGSGASAGTLGASSQSGIPGATSDASSGASTDAQIQVVTTGLFTIELGLDDTEIASIEVGQVAAVSLSTSTSSSGFPAGFPGFGPGAAGIGAGGDDSGASTTTEPATATTVPAASGTAINGFVSEVGKVADASSGVATYPVTVTFRDTDGTFHAGATGAVEVTVAEVTDAIQVSSIAVTTADGRSTVTVRKAGKDEERTVQTGRTANGMVQVTSGLEAGEQVVVTLPGRPGGGSGTFTPPAGFTGGVQAGGGN